MIVITNKNKMAEQLCKDKFAAMEDAGLMDKYSVIEHETKLEWSFDNPWDLFTATEYMANKFEYVQKA